MVLYFTGTGNSRYIAEKIADALGQTLFSINEAIKYGKNEPIETGRAVIIVTPTYAWRIPRIVRDWLQHAELRGAENIWFVMDCGDEIGNAAKYNKQMASQKNLQYMGTAQIVMPENYIALFDIPSEEKAKAIIEEAQPAIEQVITELRKECEFPVPRCNLYDRVMSGPVNVSFYPLFVKAKAFSAGDGCISCKKCVQICPLNNISLQNGKPVWGKKCTHCMACISYCPKQVIEYGKHSVGLRRYHYDN